MGWLKASYDGAALGVEGSTGGLHDLPRCDRNREVGGWCCGVLVMRGTARKELLELYKIRTGRFESLSLKL